MSQPEKNAWPFNPNFPQPFLFPACGLAEWLALSIWSRFAGDVSKIPCADKIESGDPLNWVCVWGDIFAYNSCPPLKPETVHSGVPYSIKNPEGWVMTLLGAHRFWHVEINAWALDMVEKEFRELNSDGVQLGTYAMPGGEAQCEYFCRRFRAYQQARYRWHEHLLEKHCERALDANASGRLVGYIPQTGAEARASLIGWLSKQRGYAQKPLVKDFRRLVRIKNSRLSINEKKSFFTEREHPSERKWRADADEIGWLILTWPIWNFYNWRFVDVSYALNVKFRTNGKVPQDFAGYSVQDMGATNDSRTPMEIFDSLFPETDEERSQDRIIRRVSDDKAIEQRCRDIVRLPIVQRMKGAPTTQAQKEKPNLLDFALRLAG